MFLLPPSERENAICITAHGSSRGILEATNTSPLRGQTLLCRCSRSSSSSEQMGSPEKIEGGQCNQFVLIRRVVVSLDMNYSGKCCTAVAAYLGQERKDEASLSLKLYCLRSLVGGLQLMRMFTARRRWQTTTPRRR